MPVPAAPEPLACHLHACSDPAANATGQRLTLCMLASGSKGNAIHLSNGRTSLLIDAGLSGREIERRMRARGQRPEALTALVVTHEHSDHLHGVGVLARRWKLPVYISAATRQAAAGQLGGLTEVRTFACGERFEVEGFGLRPFSLPHDAADPAGLAIDHAGIKIGLATDLGTVTELVRHQLRNCHALILEANHDADLLLSGPYPWPLKQRVRGRTGHLSNLDARDLLGELQHKGLRHVVLAHLSEVNNRPELVRRDVACALTRCHPAVHVACQHEAGPLLELAGC